MQLIWFREDLRLSNNPALSQATCHNDPVVGIYLIDNSMWQKHHMAACRIKFLLRGLNELMVNLKKINIPVIIKEVNKTTDIPKVLYQLIKSLQAENLYFNRQYEVNESKRDHAVLAYLEPKNIYCHVFDDQIILPPGSITTKEGADYKVFTAYKRTWLQKVYQQGNCLTLVASPNKQPISQIQATDIEPFLKKWDATIDSRFWPAGEHAARKRLHAFVNDALFDYDKNRNFPAIAGSSQLSAYLSTGMLSAAECFMAAINANYNDIYSGNKGVLTWISELIWRDFYKHLLVAVPRVSMSRPYQQKTEKLTWRYDQSQYDAWINGKTGFPIIDAAMRQLNETGWMHNRLRMITATFFSKNLFFDWRLGEQYFIEHLIDGDLAANNGGWQWCASTGTDAAPYFRIFNPISQSERFDPDGEFIRKFCPELKAFNSNDIHHPHLKNPELAKKVNYPIPIVDLKQSRRNAIEAFKSL